MRDFRRGEGGGETPSKCASGVYTRIRSHVKSFKKRGVRCAQSGKCAARIVRVRALRAPHRAAAPAAARGEGGGGIARGPPPPPFPSTPPSPPAAVGGGGGGGGVRADPLPHHSPPLLLRPAPLLGGGRGAGGRGGPGRRPGLPRASPTPTSACPGWGPYPEEGGQAAGGKVRRACTRGEGFAGWRALGSIGRMRSEASHAPRARAPAARAARRLAAAQ